MSLIDWLQAEREFGDVVPRKAGEIAISAKTQ